jgi:hypothetical protein
LQRRAQSEAPNASRNRSESINSLSATYMRCLHFFKQRKRHLRCMLSISTFAMVLIVYVDRFFLLSQTCFFWYCVSVNQDRVPPQNDCQLFDE